jgi:hypothetical protein
MKKGEKKKQQKALKRRTERKAAQKTTRSLNVLPLQLQTLRRSSAFPLAGCWAQSGWQQNGLAVVVIARRQPDDLITFGAYLVDYYCLGIKNCYYNVDIPVSRFFSEFLPKMIRGGSPQEISADLAHELIYGSIEYAAQFGFRPHADFKRGQWVLDPPEQHPRTGRVTFGHEGKPFFISGPDDNVDAIMNQLLRRAGPGNYNYLAQIGPPDGDLFPEDDEAELDEWDEDATEDDIEGFGELPGTRRNDSPSVRPG